jgi:hypothetical protein
MTNEHTEHNEHAEDAGDAVEVPLTSEQRLRALTGDRKRKAKGKPKPAAGDAQHHPGDIVDAVRERSKDQGRDTPL